MIRDPAWRYLGACALARIGHTGPFALNAIAGGTFAVGTENFFRFDRRAAEGGGGRRRGWGGFDRGVRHGRSQEIGAKTGQDVHTPSQFIGVSMTAPAMGSGLEHHSAS